MTWHTDTGVRMMKRRIWIVVSAVTLTVASIGGVAALTGGDSEAGDTSPSLGVPAPGFENIDETVVSDGSDGDVAVLPPYDGPADGLPTEEPIEEPGDEAGRAAEERARALEGGVVTNGEFTEEGGESVAGDGLASSGMAVPGFEGTATETLVVVEDDAPANDADNER